MIRFYFKRGRWHVTSDKRLVNARDWWNAINQVHEPQIADCASSLSTNEWK